MGAASDRFSTALRRVRHLPDRLLHPLRRRRARRRVREIAGRPTSRGSPIDVLFVCHGNICRSPYAAGAARRAVSGELEGRVRFESAGLFGPGRCCPPLAVEVARERGVDLTGHLSRLVTPETLAAADLVFLMAPGQVLHIRDRLCPVAGRRELWMLGDLDPEIPSTRTILDPIFQGHGVFEEVFTRIDRCLEMLLESLNEGESLLRPPDTPEPKKDIQKDLSAAK